MNHAEKELFVSSDETSECRSVRGHLRCELERDRARSLRSTHVDQSRSGKLANDEELSQSPAAKVVFSRSKLSHATRKIPTALSMASIWMRRTKSSLSLFLVSGAHLALWGFFPPLAPCVAANGRVASRRLRRLTAKTLGKLGDQFEQKLAGSSCSVPGHSIATLKSPIGISGDRWCGGDL